MKKFNNLRIKVSILFIFIIVLLFCSCVGHKNSKIIQPVLSIGEARLSVPGGNIWYKVTGTGNGMPVVLLHGGPGSSSYYLKPFEELGNDRQVIRYDQLGGGKSDKISDTTMFTIDHFVKELDLLREHLGLSKWHVFGHSWGTILALEYYRAYPDRVASLTLGSAALNMSVWEQHARQLLTTLPESMQQGVRQAESTGNYNDSLYQKANNQFYSLYMIRKPGMPDLDSLFATFNEQIYKYMQGPSEFTITGTLKNYDATSFLSKIKVPTLFTVGEFDEAGPEIIKIYSDKVPDSRYVVFPGSGHITPWDARDENINVVREFLNSVDSLSNK
jgi:proline iminopeptidase